LFNWGKSLSFILNVLLIVDFKQKDDDDDDDD
jgi:hypothetical protein